MTRKFALITTVLLLTVIVAAVGCPAGTAPATPAEFYKGKTIDFVVNESPGNPCDLIARMMVSYLGGDTGTSVIVTNRRGAGGMEGMNYVYKAEPDGLTLGMASAVKASANKVMNEPGAEYVLEKFDYIMSIGRRTNYFFISPTGPYQTVADLQAAQDLKLAGGSPSGYVTLATLSVIKLLGLDAKVVTGFQGDTERTLAVERGEVAGYAVNLAGLHTYVESGMLKPMFVLARQRDPLTPDVPAITELVNLSDEDLALVKLWETSLASSTLFVTTPGIPEDRLAYLRQLAEKWTQDEGFREEINIVSGYEVQPDEYITGEEVAQAMQDMAVNLNEFQALFADLSEKYRA
jgi:tripartite-type tricarboxylate transporter receptor subunit TctC